MTERSQRIAAAVGGGLFAVVLLPLLDHLGRMELFFPILATVAMTAGVFKLCWGLRRQPSFWVAMNLVVALHVLLILYVPWRPGWIPAPTTIAFCMVDLAIVVPTIKLIGRLMDRTKGPAKDVIRIRWSGTRG